MIERVVIVDDEEGILALLRRVLRTPGREVEVFPTPQVALEAMRRARPDVVITDLHMPGMSGAAFIRTIRGEFGPRMGIVVISAFPTLVSDADVVADGIGAYLRKPFTDLDLLRSTISEVIESSRRAPEADLPQPVRRHLAAADFVLRQQRASLSRADAVLDQISDAIFILDRWLRVLQLNQAAARLLDDAAEACLGRRLPELELDPGLRDAVLDASTATVGRAGPRRVTVAATGRSYDVTSAPLVNAGGGRAGVLSVVKDVTAEVRVQELKHHYLTVLAHELRTPLTALQSFAACFDLIGPPLEPRRQELVGSMREQLLRLEHQVDRLILLARLERSDFSASSEPFNVGPAIAEAVESCQHLAREKGVAFVVGPVDLGLVAWGDVDDFRRALHEVGENAVKFTAAGGSVRVSAEAWGGEILVRVADTGIGIDARNHAGIFDEFRQLEDPLTRSQAGAGLGLSLARRMLEAVGGRITLESAPGRGARFTLHLPARARDPATRVTGAAEPAIASLAGEKASDPCRTAS